MRGSILVVDDQSGPREVLAGELEEAGYSVVEADGGDTAWSRFCEEEPDLVITDLVMPRVDGHDLLCRIRARSSVPVIVVTAHGSVEAAVRVLKAGAVDFLPTDRVLLAEVVSRACAVVDQQQDVGDHDELERRLPGTSDAIARVRSRVAGLAPLAHPVLVRGESGAGRDTVVRALHEIGATAGGSLVRIDCAGWEPTRGLPRAAAVHLDGVERLSPVGGAFWSDVLGGRVRPRSDRIPRVLATAGPAFGASVAVDRTASDLCALLSRFPIDVPPLRDRQEDVGPLAEAIVDRLSAGVGRRAVLAPAARSLLCNRRWRGDVEQLEQLLERAIAFTSAPTIEATLVSELFGELEDGLAAIRLRGVQEEREALIEALRHTGGNVSRAAARLGRSRGAVYRLMDKHGVTRSTGL